jgi:hypothetical protein
MKATRHVAPNTSRAIRARIGDLVVTFPARVEHVRKLLSGQGGGNGRAAPPIPQEEAELIDWLRRLAGRVSLKALREKIREAAEVKAEEYTAALEEAVKYLPDLGDGSAPPRRLTFEEYEVLEKLRAMEEGTADG